MRDELAEGERHHTPHIQKKTYIIMNNKVEIKMKIKTLITLITGI